MILLYGAIPVRGIEFIHGADIIAEVKAQLEMELGIVDYRLVDFNKGPAMLAAGIRQYFADNEVEGFVYLDNRTDEGRHCFTAFSEAADGVIRSIG